jgi:Phosphate-induced protein 1 conserved region
MRLRSLGLALAMSGLMTAAAGAQLAFQDDGGLVPTGKGWGVPAPGLEKRGKPKPPPPPPANNGIEYHKGPVMLGTVNIYYIWYGDWNANSAVDILTEEAESIGGTPWFNINTTYYSGSGRTLKHVSNSVAYKGSTTDDYSHGKTLSDDDVFEIVTDAITSGRLPKDSNGVYFVLTSADVDETSGFCVHYCGWHFFGNYAKTALKYAFIGNAARCPSGSSAPTATSAPTAWPRSSPTSCRRR